MTMDSAPSGETKAETTAPAGQPNASPSSDKDQRSNQVDEADTKTAEPSNTTTIPRGPTVASSSSTSSARPPPPKVPARPVTHAAKSMSGGTNSNTSTKPAPFKKRKLSASTTTTGSSMNASAVAKQPRPASSLNSAASLTDKAVIKAVHDILGLLQTYGPLSFSQLEYNLPPHSSLSDILQILVATGVVQVVDGPPPTRYTTLQGKVRADVVLPHKVMDEIIETQTQVQQSLERTKILKQALMQTKNGNANVNVTQVLQKLLMEFPDIVRDPVYMAAFRNFAVDVTEHTSSSSSTTSKRTATKSSSGSLKKK